MNNFKKFLDITISEGAETMPFSDKEIMEILNNFGPPSGVDEVEEEELITLMKKTYDNLVALESGLNNPL